MKLNLYFKFGIIALATFMMVTSCLDKQSKDAIKTEEQNHKEEEYHEEEQTHEREGLIIVSAEQEKMLGVEKITIQPEVFHQVIACAGEILPAQGEEKTVVATTNGIIAFAKQGITQGIGVKAGELLFTIQSKNIGDGDVAMKAKNLYNKEKKEYERAQELIAYKLVSEKEFNEIKLNYDNAKLAYNALTSSSSGSGVGASSPMNGFIKSVIIGDGEYVTTGQPLAVVTQSNRLQLRASVSQKYVQNSVNIQSANIVLPCNQGAYSLSKLNGKVLSYGKTLDQNDFYLPINFSFDNVGNIIPGSLVEVYLLANPKANSKVVPLTALLEEQGNFFVMANLHDDEFQERRVVLGASDGINVEILEGLEMGDIVVSKGGYLVKQVKALSAIPDGHNH